MALGRQEFAWEWLRRDPRYQAAWLARGASSGNDRAASFGLIAMVDPSLRASVARPLWRAHVDRSVLVAEVLDADPPPFEGLDLLAVASLVTLEVSQNDDEHVLLSDGQSSIRIDIIRGSLLGGRALLSYQLWGALRLKAPILSLRRLINLIVTGRFASSLFPAERLAGRWILELRVGDALADGASHREIAQMLFEPILGSSGWRNDGGSVRSRVQRVVRAARRRTEAGAHLAFLATP